MWTAPLGVDCPQLRLARRWNVNPLLYVVGNKHGVARRRSFPHALQGDAVRCDAPHMHRYIPLRRLCTVSQDVSLYALLDISPTASASEIKRAFRQKAKLYHPDVRQSNKDGGQFARILVAYQVLSNNRQRELYDLSLKSTSASVHRAAEEGSRQAEQQFHQSEAEWVPGAGWFAWATKPSTKPNASQVDRLRAELRTEFNAAVRHAYLGPRVRMDTGELPEAFEGEERTVAGVGDVLHLVSGRQLLGVVRERHDAKLQGSTAFLDKDYLRHLDSRATSCNATDNQSRIMHDHQLISGQTESSGAAATVSPILELGAHCNGKSAEPWTCIYAMDGSVLATEQEGNVYKGGDTGRHTHTILTGQTPLVRHLHIVSNSQGGKELSICRCRRAWLPPSSTWLFPPRSQDHASGGWYFEWSGHMFNRHPAWLHPAVFVLLAAFDTLTHEAHANTVPLQARAKNFATDQPNSKVQHMKQWLSSMWQFHRQP
ncbi:hypothetical protein WJX79_002800 [Trebouxia sp. C0005]